MFHVEGSNVTFLINDTNSGFSVVGARDGMAAASRSMGGGGTSGTRTTPPTSSSMCRPSTLSQREACRREQHIDAATKKKTGNRDSVVVAEMSTELTRVLSRWALGLVFAILWLGGLYDQHFW